MTLPTSSSRWHSSVPRAIFSACDFSRRRKREHVSECPAPLLCRTLAKRPISLLPHPEYRVMSCLTKDQKEPNRTADKTLRAHSRNADLTNCIEGSFKKSAPKLLATPHTHTSRLAHRHPSHLRTSGTNTPTLWLALCPLKSSKSNIWQMASEHTNISPNLQAREKPQTSVLAPPLEKQKGSCQHPA